MIIKVAELKYDKLVIILYITILIILVGCGKNIPSATVAGRNIILDPDYTSISIPVNIAPLNFRIKEHGEKYLVRFYNRSGNGFIVSSGSGDIDIPGKKWQKLLSASESDEIFEDVFVRQSGKWKKFNTISNYVSPDSIDRYLVYRLIEPGYETWNQMGIYQRNLETFREEPIMLNTLSNGNCMNCHTFCKNRSDKMMFHMRGRPAGTIICSGQQFSKINTKTPNTISAGVYPSWHPSGDYIAYSVNNIVQSFHSVPTKRIEVYDTLSDIIVYNVKKNAVSTCRNLSDPEKLETFPTWSPDGKYLYFCRAMKLPMNKNNQIRYDLFRISFNTEDSRFGQIDTVLFVSQQGRSISFPRISPDSRYLLFCLSDYGNFSIWHPESDIYLLDLSTGRTTRPDINSSRSDSYHAWSSTGRWIVFSSKRMDGLYTNLFISYFDSAGLAHKPFILPQRDPGFYFNFLKSYNLPELVTSHIDLTPGMLEKIAGSDPVNARFDAME